MGGLLVHQWEVHSGEQVVAYLGQVVEALVLVVVVVQHLVVLVGMVPLDDGLAQKALHQAEPPESLGVVGHEVLLEVEVNSPVEEVIELAVERQEEVAHSLVLLQP